MSLFGPSIRYFNPELGAFQTWRPFAGWLWEQPLVMHSCRPVSSISIRTGATVRVVHRFRALDAVQIHAIAEKRLEPSPAPLHILAVHIGDIVRVEGIYSIRGVTWLACFAVPSGRIGLLPLFAVACPGVPTLRLREPFLKPIHGSARSYQARYKWLDGGGSTSAQGKFEGIVGRDKIIYRSRLMSRVPWHWTTVSRSISMVPDRTS